MLCRSKSFPTTPHDLGVKKLLRHWAFNFATRLRIKRAKLGSNIAVCAQVWFENSTILTKYANFSIIFHGNIVQLVVKNVAQNPSFLMTPNPASRTLPSRR